MYLLAYHFVTLWSKYSYLNLASNVVSQLLHEYDVVTKYINDTVNEHTQVLEANNTSYIYGNSRVASINKNKSLLIDTLNGSVNKIISKGNIETINYSPNGVTTKTNGYLYNGEAKDATGLIYLRARYYNPEIGIFIQIDSHQGKKESLLSQNRYTYAENNPYKNIDPSGHSIISIMKKIKNAVKKAINEAKKFIAPALSLLNKLGLLVPKVSSKNNSAINKIANSISAFTNALSTLKPESKKSVKPSTIKGKSVDEKKLEKQYKNALKSRKGNANQWTSDGKTCFILTDKYNKPIDSSSIWFIENGKTYRIVKQQCINYKGTSKSSSDIGASLGDPTYKKIEGNGYFFKLLEQLLSPLSSFVFKTLWFMVENALGGFLAIWDLGKLLCQGKVSDVLNIVGQSAVYMVGYMLLGGIGVILMGFFPSIIWQIFACVGTATFALLVELAFIDFNMDKYKAKYKLKDDEIWPHMIAKVADFAFLVKFLKKLVDKKTGGTGNKDKNKDTGEKKSDKEVSETNTGQVLSNGQSLDEMADLYAKIVNGNGKWSWMDDFPDAKNLSKEDKVFIRNSAIEKGLIQNVPVSIITDSSGKTYRYADFDSAGLVKQKIKLPKNLWTESDAIQFKWLDKQIGGRPPGYTWHHSEISGQMELIPTGIHNVYNHNGGRTLNHWAYREGGR